MQATASGNLVLMQAKYPNTSRPPTRSQEQVIPSIHRKILHLLVYASVGGVWFMRVTEYDVSKANVGRGDNLYVFVLILVWHTPIFSRSESYQLDDRQRLFRFSSPLAQSYLILQANQPVALRCRYEYWCFDPALPKQACNIRPCGSRTQESTRSRPSRVFFGLYGA